MKRFISGYRRTIWAQHRNAALSLSAFLYCLIRCLSFDFPMSWGEEMAFFLKVFCSASALVMISAIFLHTFYFAVLRLRRQTRRL